MRQSSTRLPRIDDLRGVAAGLVFLCHAGLLWSAFHETATSTQLLYLGRLGVAIFFVITGVVIYRPFVLEGRGGRRVELWRYTVRRIARIVPPYWLALAVFAVLLPRDVPLLHGENVGRFAGFAQIYSHSFYRGGLGVAWSLDVEVCFYAAAPLIALSLQLLSRRARERVEPLLLLAFGLSSIGIRWLSPDGVIGGTIVGYMGWFAIGMALARTLDDPRWRPWLDRVGVAAPWGIALGGYVALTTVLSNVVPNQGTLLDYVGLGLLAALIVVPAIDPRARATRIGAWFGERSYGIYLWHLPILTWLARWDQHASQYLAGGVLLTLLAAQLSYHLVELPLIRRAGLLRGRSSAGPSARPAKASPTALAG